MAVINRSIRSATGGGNFNATSVPIDEETQKLELVTAKDNSTIDKKTAISEVSLDGKKIPVVNGKYNAEVIKEVTEDGKVTQTLRITDWNYSNEPVLEFDTTFANNTPAQISAISAEISKNNEKVSSL